jgi:hypothetical protein
MILRKHHITLLLFGLAPYRDAFANVSKMLSSEFSPLFVIPMMLGLTFGLLSGFSEFKRPWLALAMSALVAFLVCALLHRYVDPILAIILVVIYIVSAIVFVIIQALRAEFSLKPELRNVWWKSPSKIIVIATVGCFVHAILDAVPTYYCRSAKKVFTPAELCVELFDRELNDGSLLLGPEEKSAKDYYNNHPDFCRHGLTNFYSSQGAPNSWRLGGLYEFLFFDQTLHVSLKYHTTRFGRESWQTKPLVDIWYQLDNCLKVLQVPQSI